MITVVVNQCVDSLNVTRGPQHTPLATRGPHTSENRKPACETSFLLSRHYYYLPFHMQNSKGSLFTSIDQYVMNNFISSNFIHYLICKIKSKVYQRLDIDVFYLFNLVSIIMRCQSKIITIILLYLMFYSKICQTFN